VRLAKNASLLITSAPAGKLAQGCKGRIKIASAAGMQDMDLQSELPGCGLQLPGLHAKSQ
jgi:hypothetical protein